MSETVTIDRHDQVATITFRNPSSRNALTPPMQEAAIEHLNDVSYDDDVRCVVLTGEAPAFCAGADVSVLEGISPKDLELGIEDGFHEIVRLIMTMKKPVIAKVDGPAVGGGVNIAMSCDFVYASEGSVFGWIFSQLGVTQDSGTSFILPRLTSMRNVAELVYREDPIDAAEALEYDLVNDVMPASELDDVVQSKAEDLASGPTKAYGETKRMLLRGSHASLQGALENERLGQTVVFETEDVEQGISSFLEGTDPEFVGK